MELLVMVDALKRASAGRITAAIPISAMPARIAAALRARADHRQAGRQHAVRPSA